MRVQESTGPRERRSFIILWNLSPEDIRFLMRLGLELF